MDTLLTRIDSAMTLSSVLESAAGSFGLGNIQSSATILTGYQDYNVELTTSTGRYVVKIFAKDKTIRRIDDVLWAYEAFAKKHVPVPTLRHTTDGQTRMELAGVEHPSYLCVFDFFPGKPLTRVPVTDTDLVTLTNAMSAIHKTQHTIQPYYDTLAIANVQKEFQLKKDALSADELSLITPVIAKFSRIKLPAFPQSIIHGTFEKENVLKNPAGDLCLLDFGCMDYNASVLDIATCIANVTLYLDKVRRDQVIRVMLDTYHASRPLTPEERAALPTLIRCQYAAYAIGMSHHMRIDHDMSKQTQTWLDRGWDGLKAYAKVTRIV